MPDQRDRTPSGGGEETGLDEDSKGRIREADGNDEKSQIREIISWLGRERVSLDGNSDGERCCTGGRKRCGVWWSSNFVHLLFLPFHSFLDFFTS